MFILPFLTIEEAVEQAVEEAVEEAVEAVEDAAEEAAETPNSETPHVVSLEERLAECQARIAVLETRLPQVEQEAQEASQEAEHAQSVAETALEVAISDQSEEELAPLSEPEPVEVPPQTQAEETKPRVSFWEALLGGR